MIRRWLPLVCGALTACSIEQTRPTNLGELRFVTSDGGISDLTAEHDFGVTPLGTSTKWSVSVVNVGRDPLTMSAPSLISADTGAYFALGPGGRVEVGAKRAFEVTFAPVREGEQTARLLFEHDAEAPSAVMSLRGTGSR